MNRSTATGVDPRTGLIELDRDECLLLRTSTPGRFAVVIDEHPLVFPVNFTPDGNAVVLRTDEGTKLYAARRGFVAFECDDIDRSYHTGWSVLISGNAEETGEAAELARPSRLPLGPWAQDRNRYGCASDPARSPGGASLRTVCANPKLQTHDVLNRVTRATRATND